MNHIQKVLSIALLSLFLVPAISFAQEEEEQSRFANVQTQKVKALPQDLAKKLEPVRAALAPEDETVEPNPREALELIQRIRLDNEEPFAQAEVHNLYGYIYYSLEDNTRAREYYLKVVNEPEANAPLINRTLKTVAQLFLVDEMYPQALEYYKAWMSLQDPAILSPNDYSLLANIYYNMDDLANSLTSIETAIAMRAENGEIGEENWYSIQRSIYYQNENYEKVLEILETLVVHYPSVRYWREMSSMYAQLEIEDKQRAALDVAYMQNGLTSEGQLISLAYMYMGMEAPYKGAQLLIEGIENNVVDPDEKIYQAIGSALYTARSLQEALPWMERAASLSETGDSFSRLAGIYLDLERYDDAIRTANQALNAGGVDRTELVLMTLGSAYFHKKQYQNAIDTFSRINSRYDQRSQQSARDWIRYVNAEKRRAEQLRRAGIVLS